MKPLAILKFSAAGLTGIGLANVLAADSPAPPKPNIVLILADDVGYECFGSYGCKDYQTPILDRLAAQGARFTHCYSTPLCTPSRVELLTGRYTNRNYIGFGQMPPNEITFANILQDAGYRTCISGKWQLGNDLDAPKKLGFDEYCLWQINGRDSRYWQPRYVKNGQVMTDIKEKYGPDILVDFGLKFIEENKDRPFLFYYTMVLAHKPFCPTPNTDGKRSDSNDSPEYFRANIAYIDKLVGRIDDRLKELGVRDNTILLFVGDNGTHRQIITRTDKGKIRGGKGMTTDAGTHVPLIVSWPNGIKRPVVCNDLVDFSDFLPTLAEAAGVKIPADRIIDGRSFLPQLEGKPGNPRQWTFLHYWDKGRNREKIAEAVWNQRWKLYGDGKLYDIKADPLEEKPVLEKNPETEAARELLQKAFNEVKNKK